LHSASLRVPPLGAVWQVPEDDENPSVATLSSREALTATIPHQDAAPPEWVRELHDHELHDHEPDDHELHDHEPDEITDRSTPPE
jgi:hypothetical protein